MYYLFPFHEIEKNSRIILFGTGKMGKDYYFQVKATNYCSIVGWTNSDILMGEKRAFPFCNMEQVNERSFDYVVIAIYKDEVVNSEVLPLLQKQGIEKNIVIWSKGEMIGDEIRDKHLCLWGAQREAYLFEDVRDDLLEKKTIWSEEMNEKTIQIPGRRYLIKNGIDWIEKIITYYRKEGGIIFCSRFEENNLFVIKKVEEKQQLVEGCGYRFIQSEIRSSYEEIREHLTSGKKVLFFGTPCQVAGVKKFLRDIDTKELLLCDFLCRGVLSKEVWQSGFEELDAGAEKVGIEKRIVALEELYKNGYGFCEECYQCIYHSCNREGDFSFGGLSQNSTEDNVMVTLNSQKGKRFLENVITEDKLEMLGRHEIGTNVVCSFLSPEKQKRFLDMFRRERRTPLHLYKRAEEERFDIALVGGYHWSNYGDEITYYALYYLLTSWGYDVLMVNWCKDLRMWTRRKPLLFESNPYPEYALHYPKSSKEELDELNQRIKCFLVGSGMYLHEYIIQNIDYITLLEWVDRKIPKIGYSVAWGNLGFDNECNRRRQSNALERFQGIGVREYSGMNIAKNILGLENVEKVLDPVLVVPREMWTDLLGKEKKGVPFLYAYILDNMTENVRAVLEEWENRSGLPLKVVTRYEKADQYTESWKNLVPKAWLEGWLRGFRDAEYVVTDSFHGICLCLCFHTQFSVFIGNRHREETRVYGLLESLGLSERVLKSLDNYGMLESQMKMEINFEKIEQSLDEQRAHSLSWLRNQLEQAVGGENER